MELNLYYYYYYQIEIFLPYNLYFSLILQYISKNNKNIQLSLFKCLYHYTIYYSNIIDLLQPIVFNCIQINNIKSNEINMYYLLFNRILEKITNLIYSRKNDISINISEKDNDIKEDNK